MWHIQKIDPADLIVDIQYIAFVGAGGKTSFIEYLAEKTARGNKKTVRRNSGISRNRTDWKE